MTIEMDDNRWCAYALEHNLPLPNFKSSSASSTKSDETKFTFRSSKDYRNEPLSTIKDQKSNSSTQETNDDVIEEHSET